MAAGPGPSAVSSTRWEGRLDCRAQQFAEAGGDEVKAGHDIERLLPRTIRGDNVAVRTLGQNELFSAASGGAWQGRDARPRG